MKTLRYFAIPAAILMIAIAFFVTAAQARSAEETQAILDYKLSMPIANQLLSAMGPMTRYVASLPDLRERMARASTQTLAERVAQVEKDPKAMAILKQNSLTARDYIVGVPALRQAIWLASGRNAPNLVASPANLAFAKANLAELKPRMDAADGMSSPRKVAATRNFALNPDPELVEGEGSLSQVTTPLMFFLRVSVPSW